MTIARTAQALAALGHETRLTLFRLLVRAGEDGLSVGEIGDRLGRPASTLAHHIGALADAGLIHRERRGREIRCRADYAAIRATTAFLMDECCADARAEAAQTEEEPI